MPEFVSVRVGGEGGVGGQLGSQVSDGSEGSGRAASSVGLDCPPRVSINIIIAAIERPAIADKSEGSGHGFV